MNKKLSWFLILCPIFIFALYSCQSGSERKKRREQKRDTTITVQNAFLDKFLDSAEVTQFLDQARLSSDDSLQISDFYKSRNYQYAWFDSAGMTEHAHNFMSLYRTFRNERDDSSLVDKKLDATFDKISEDSSYLLENRKVMANTELKLTTAFFKYSEKAYTGTSGIDPEKLGWFIPKKKIDIAAFLDSVVTANGKISDYEPVHPMFTPLHDYLEKYSKIEQDSAWRPIAFDKKSYKENDSAAAIGAVKKKLQLIGDLSESDTGNVFTAETKEGVINFQKRFGLKEDGVLAQKTMSELNVPIEDRIKQLAVNIERIKWLPKPGPGRYVVANIPAFKLYAYDHDKVLWDMNVVVGSEGHSTVVFSDVLETIAFSPYWNVPYSIVKNEMANKDDAYFARNGYEVVGHYSNGLPQIRQLPGPKNALGKVKFLFPNSYAIYFHDTPSKWLFNQNDRAASHGCIRLADPTKMAEWLLETDSSWNKEKVEEAMNLTKEKQIKLKDPVPVYIVYFTAWVDSKGKLNFRDDIYGHDQDMINRLFAVN